MDTYVLCIFYTYNFNPVIFNIFIWSEEIQGHKLFNILQYVKSLKRLTWTKYSSTPGLRFLLWIMQVDQNTGSQSFHPSPTEGFNISPFIAMGTVWNVPQVILIHHPRSYALVPALHSTTAQFSEALHSSKVCHFRYRKITTQWPGRYLTVLF